MRALFILENVVEKHLALRRFVWIFSQCLGLLKAGKIECGDAEVRGGKCSFFPASIFHSSDLRASAPPVRCFLLLAVP